jgi:ADP-ribose pyrophosphatase YjhB (NUDIX family)
MEEKALDNATICFPKRGNEILLAIKTDKIGKGLFNGYGGGIEDGEGVIESAIREFGEESGVSIVPKQLEKIAVVDFHNTKSDGSTFVCRCHIFLVHDLKEEVTAKEKMINPEWFDISNLPFDRMMPADRDFLSLALAGEKVYVKAYLGPFQKTKLRETEIVEVESFDSFE